MDWQSSMRTSFEKGKKEGLEEADADTQKLILLTQTLIAANRMDDLARALKDVSY